jgi:hypothetical protein
VQNTLRRRAVLVDFTQPGLVVTMSSMSAAIKRW